MSDFDRILKGIDNEQNEKQNLVFTILDNLNRPQYGIANVINDAVDGGNFNPLKSLWEGVSLQEKKSIGDALTEIGWEPESKVGKVAKFITGFAGDVLTDPLTYTGIGLASKGGALIKGGTTANKAIKAKRALGLATEAKSAFTFGAFGKRAVLKSNTLDNAMKALGRGSYAVRQNKVVAPVLDKVADIFSTKMRPSTIDPLKWNKWLRIKDEVMNAAKKTDIDITKLSDRMKKRVAEIGLDEKTQGEILQGLETQIQKTVKKADKAGIVNTLDVTKEEFNKLKQVADDSIEKAKGTKYATKIRDILDEQYKKTFGKDLDTDTYKHLTHIMAKKSGIPMKKEFIDPEIGRHLKGLKRDNGIIVLPKADTDIVVNLKTGNVFGNGDTWHDFKLSDDQVKALIESEKFLYDLPAKTINDVTGVKIFSTDIADVLTAQAKAVARVSVPDQLIKQATKGLAKEFKKIPNAKEADGYVKLSNDITKAIPEMNNKYFPKDVAKDLNKVYELFAKPEKKKEFIKLFDKVQNEWKGIATFMNPSFHIRNSISNLYQNSLAGVNNPADYVEAAKLEKLYHTKPSLLTKTQREIYKEYQKQGLSTVGRASGDIPDSILKYDNMLDEFRKTGKLKQKITYKKLMNGKFEKQIRYPNQAKKILEKQVDGKATKTIIEKPELEVKDLHKVFDMLLTPHRKIKEFGAIAGQAIENNAKLAHFIAKRKEGLSAFDAGRSVKKYLFDYQDLTDVERKYFKRVLPFYTWSRKNIPLQLESLVKTPSVPLRILKMKNNIEILAGDEETAKTLPDWLKEAAPVYIGKSSQGKSRYLKLEGLLPIADLTKLKPDNAISSMLEMLSPVLKTPVEQMLNYNFFFGTRITGQTKAGLGNDLLAGFGIGGLGGVGERDFLNSRIGGRLDHLARLYRPISEIEKLFGRKYKGKDSAEKVGRFTIGSVIYSEDPRVLLKKFNRLTKSEESNIIRQINYLRDQVKKEPTKREQNYKDIKTLRSLLIKAKIKSRKKRANAR